MIIEEAIFKLNPTVVNIRGNVAYDANEQVVSYDLAAAQALVDANAYKASRAAEYPAIGDQLDDLFHAGLFSDEMMAKIQAIKDKYPKA